MAKLTILALDLGTRTGWAMSRNDGSQFSGTKNFTVKKGGHPGSRFYGLYKFLAETPYVDVIAYEDVRRHVGTKAAHVYGGLKAVVESYAFDNDIELVPVGVGAIKKHATGSGRADKAQMIAAAKEKWHWFRGDDNEADAMHLLDFVRSAREEA